jgi:hypothetical protein
VNSQANTVASAPTPLPVRWGGFYGIRLTYEAEESALLASGLLLASEVPGLKTGCFRQTGPTREVLASRLKGGAIRLKICADLAGRRTIGFKQFIGGLLADTRFSLVRGERST